MFNAFDPDRLYPDENKNEWAKPLIGLGVLAFIVLAAVGFYYYKDRFFTKSMVSPAVVMSLAPDELLDKDNDGLSAAEEGIYGTDPENPDTDGDGYNDGDEVRKGYDPLGPGKMNYYFKKVAAYYIEINELGINSSKDLSDKTAANASMEGYDMIINMKCAEIGYRDDNCLMFQAFSKKDTSLCNKLTIPGDRIDCINAIAVSYDREKDCARLPSQDYRDECYYNISKNKRELSLCKKIRNQYFRYDCIRDIAFMELDQRVCSEIDDPEAVNPNSIAGFNEMKADCYVAIAILNKDKQQCANIPLTPYPTDYEGEPRYMCYAIIAGIKKDMNSCTAIRDEFRRDVGETPYENHGGILVPAEIRSYVKCIEDIADEIYQVSDCQAVKDQETKERCLKEIAQASKDQAICDLINDELIADRCYAAVGSLKTDFTICQKINDVISKNKCFRGLAQNTGDKEVCKYVTESDRNTCYKELAQKLQDDSICSLMKVNAVDDPYCVRKEGFRQQSCSEYSRDMCYYAVGIAKKSREACNKVIGDYRRNVCLKSIR